MYVNIRLQQGQFLCKSQISSNNLKKYYCLILRTLYTYICICHNPYNQPINQSKILTKPHTGKEKPHPSAT